MIDNISTKDQKIILNFCDILEYTLIQNLISLCCSLAVLIQMSHFYSHKKVDV